jgi:alpha-tubulin suppressor-like RCC1 family protein
MTARIVSFLAAFLAIPHEALLASSPPGRVYAWGQNVLGQGGGDLSAVPWWSGEILISGTPLTNAVAISAGKSHGLALRSDGTVVGFGFNFYGQATGIGSAHPDTAAGVVTIGSDVLSNVVAISAGDTFSLALKRDGTVVAWGEQTESKASVPKNLTNVVTIAADGAHSLASRGDGSVVTWGRINEVPEEITNITAVSTAPSWYASNLGLTRDGTVLQWISKENPVLIPAGLTNTVAIAAGSDHRLALRRDSTVFGWGANESGQSTGVPSHEPLNESASGTVELDGNVLTNVVAIAAARKYSMALKNDGTVVGWGNKRLYDPVPSDMTNVTEIAVGEGFCLAIKKP